MNSDGHLLTFSLCILYAFNINKTRLILTLFLLRKQYELCHFIYFNNITCLFSFLFYSTKVSWVFIGYSWFPVQYIKLPRHTHTHALLLPYIHNIKWWLLCHIDLLHNFDFPPPPQMHNVDLTGDQGGEERERNLWICWFQTNFDIGELRFF